MFGKLALAVLVCTGFVACSSDDDETTNPNGGVIGGKKITMLVRERAGIITFDYDSEGKLVMASNTDPFSDPRCEYTWSYNAIDYTISGRKHRSYVLKNNLVQKDVDEDGWSDYFYYNSASQLKKWSPDGGLISLEWDGDKLTSVTFYDEDNSLVAKQTITYGGCCNAGYNPLIVNVVDVDEIAYAHPELFGLRSTQLPSSITTEIYEQIFTERNYEYEFDEAGYITKIVGKVESEIVETWTITWE